MKKKLSILKNINNKTAEDINEKFPADWDMDRIFKSSYKKYISRKQSASDIIKERVNEKMADRAIDVKIIRKGILFRSIAVLAVLAAVTAVAGVFLSMKKERNEQKTDVTDNYFVASNYSIPECVHQPTGILKAADRLIITGEMDFSENRSATDKNSMESKTAPGLCITDMSGKIISQKKISDTYFSKIYISDNSDIYVYMIVDQNEYSESECPIPAHFIDHLDTDGKCIEHTRLNINQECYIKDMFVDPEGRYILACSQNKTNSIYLLDTDGSVLSQVKCEDETDILHLFKKDDSVFQLSKHSDITEIRKIDFENKTTEEIIQTDFTIQSCDKVFCGNNEYDFFLSKTDGIYGYNLKENKLTEIVNYIESDIPHMVRDIWVTDDDNFLYNYYDNKMTDELNFSLMTRADEETLKKISKKKVITVACDISELVTPDVSEFWNSAVEFNKNSEEYRLKLKNLPEEDDCFFRSPDLKSNNRTKPIYDIKSMDDMIKGSIPDVIICNQLFFDISRYASMGVFADMNELIKNDSEINRSDFFENILDAYESDGKLYYIPSTFSLNTLSGKMSVLGERNMLTYEQLFDMNKKQPVLINQDRYSVINMFIKKNLSDFVNYSDRTCDFDNKDFVELLEFIKTSCLSYKEYKEINDMDNNVCSCFMKQIYSYKNEANDQLSINGKENDKSYDKSYIGMPFRDGGSAVAQSASIISISEKSQNKEGAWEFVKSILSEENQIKCSYDFPILKSAFNKQAENVFEDNDRYEKRLSNTPKNKDLVRKIRNLAESVRHAAAPDTGINSIIDEQTELFLNGSQSAEETAKQIQKKVEIYLKEID